MPACTTTKLSTEHTQTHSMRSIVSLWIQGIEVRAWLSHTTLTMHNSQKVTARAVSERRESEGVRQGIVWVIRLHVSVHLCDGPPLEWLLDQGLGHPHRRAAVFCLCQTPTVCAAVVRGMHSAGS